MLAKSRGSEVVVEILAAGCIHRTSTPLLRYAIKISTGMMQRAALKGIKQVGC